MGLSYLVFSTSYFSAFTQIFYSKCVLLLYLEKNNRCLLSSVECGTALLSKFVFLSLALIIKITTDTWNNDVRILKLEYTYHIYCHYQV